MARVFRRCGEGPPKMWLRFARGGAPRSTWKKKGDVVVFETKPAFILSLWPGKREELRWIFLPTSLYEDPKGAKPPQKIFLPQVQIYITGAFISSDVIVLAAAAQTFLLTCNVCSTSTTAYLSSKANGCDVTDKNAGQTADGDKQTAAALLQATTTSSNTFSLTVDASLLTVGDYYTLCTDMDGTTTTLAAGDAQQFAYIAPASLAWRTDWRDDDMIKKHRPVVNPLENQEVHIRCSPYESLCFANQTQAFLADDCTLGTNVATPYTTMQLAGDVDPSFHARFLDAGYNATEVIVSGSEDVYGIRSDIGAMFRTHDHLGGKPVTDGTFEQSATRHLFLCKRVA